MVSNLDLPFHSEDKALESKMPPRPCRHAFIKIVSHAKKSQRLGSILSFMQIAVHSSWSVGFPPSQSEIINSQRVFCATAVRKCYFAFLLPSLPACLPACLPAFDQGSKWLTLHVFLLLPPSLPSPLRFPFTADRPLLDG